MTFIIILLVITFILNIIDYLQTSYVVNIFGAAAELNPIMQSFIETNSMWVVKLVFFPLLLVFIGWVIYKFNFGRWAAWTLAIYYYFVVMRNFYILIMAGLL